MSLSLIDLMARLSGKKRWEKSEMKIWKLFSDSFLKIILRDLKNF
jgi:hypothetical protein